jgi:hypothetical protein
VEHWEDGGPTETANLIAVCPAHHRMHHRGELGIEGDNADHCDGIRFLTASGCPLGGVRTPRPPLAGEPPPVRGYYEHPLGERLHTELITFGQPANPN